MTRRAGFARFATGVVALALVFTATIVTSPLASAATITQASPTSGSTDVAKSAAFTATLAATPAFTGVTFASSTPGFTVTPDGVLSTSGPLSVAGSPYVITGTDANASGDSGTWRYSLTVTPDVIVQASPTTGVSDGAGSATFTSALSAAKGFVGPVTFATTKSNPSLTVSTSGVVSTKGTLSGGSYRVSGTDADSHGDSGAWAFTLAVVETVTFEANGGTGTMAPERASGPTSLTLNHFTRAGHTFVDWNSAANGSGVSYLQRTVFPFRTSATLFAQWSSKRTRSGTITFVANGGSGSMAKETHHTPSAISTNGFTRTDHTFTGWNTSANGSGTHFNPGVTYPFKKSVTLYAQWKVATPSSRVVIFLANRGVGTMAVEHHRKPAALTRDRFTRTGYTFTGWNTAANGLGIAYANGATYPFAVSTNLYAQWKLSSRVVIFDANGGVGTMAVEHRLKPTALTRDRFTRTGYSFIGWNTAANGLGVEFANGASYPFAVSTMLYAQWKKNATAPPPVLTGGITIGPFGVGSSTLSPALKSQVRTIANEVKANGTKQITLYGYGDKLTAANDQNKSLEAKNLELARMRAQVVATRLEGSLTALGLKGWTISIAAAQSGQVGTSQAVIATLS